MKKNIQTKCKKIWDERGLIGLIFSPGDYFLNKTLNFIFARKTVLKINAVDIYLRYKAISEKIKEVDKQIIEVGGAHSVLFSFITDNHKITLVDIDKEYKSEKWAYVCVLGTSLPFATNHFDCLVSVATLEHIPKQEREEAIKEWKRIAKKCLIYVPFGQIGITYDKKLYFLRKCLGFHDKWTYEHIKYGLPTEEELKTYFPGSSIQYIQNANVWLTTTFLSSVPILGRLFPGILYTFLSSIDKKEPFIGCVIEWNKS